MIIVCIERTTCVLSLFVCLVGDSYILQTRGESALGSHPHAVFAVASMANNTAVTVYKFNNTFLNYFVNYTFKLNRGQSYISTSNPNVDFTGYKITSTNSVVIISGKLMNTRIKLTLVVK